MGKIKLKDVVSLEKFPYHIYKYPRPALTTDAIVSYKGHILLVTRKNDPYKGKLALPGGYVNMDERISEACSRELLEETSLYIPSKDLRLLHIADSVNRDTRGRTISVVYGAELMGFVYPTAGDDAEYADWYVLSYVLDNPSRLAFDHSDIIRSVFA